ncbi:MAG: hypothetical protein ACKO5K_13100 [Armatimonadota bacterium]
MKRTNRGGWLLLLGIPAAIAVLMPSADAEIARSARPASSRERDALVGDALATLGDSFRSTAPGAWTGTIVFSDGRRQSVAIATDGYAFAAGDDTARARRIESTVVVSRKGLPAGTVRRLMSEHDGAGAFRLESAGGGERLVYSAVVPDTIDASQLARAVESAALVADETEAVLASGNDRF